MEIIEDQLICKNCLKIWYQQEITFTEKKIKEANDTNTRIPIPRTQELENKFIEAEKAEWRH